MKTNVLVAILAGLMGRTPSPYEYRAQRRTVKVRPANYTHPMVVSSRDEINGRVALAKQDRKMQRQRTSRAMRDWLRTSGGVTAWNNKARSSKTTAYLRKQTDTILDARVARMHLDSLFA